MTFGTHSISLFTELELCSHVYTFCIRLNIVVFTLFFLLVSPKMVLYYLHLDCSMYVLQVTPFFNLLFFHILYSAVRQSPGSNVFFIDLNSSFSPTVGYLNYQLIQYVSFQDVISFCQGGNTFFNLTSLLHFVFSLHTCAKLEAKICEYCHLT